MRVVLAGLLLAVCIGCGGDDRGGERFELYHLETAIGPPGDDGEVRCGPPTVACPGIVKQPPRRTYRYAVREMPAVTGDDIDRSTVSQAVDPATGAPIVFVPLTAEGRRAFAGLTREAARFGARDQGWHHVAVVVGDEIVAFPQIDYDDHPNGITAAPGIQITAATVARARDLARRLRDD
jgi:preprotein translocase subunit SecD